MHCSNEYADARTCGKKVTKPGHRINRLILPDIRKISFFRQYVINFGTLMVKYVSEAFLA
jgi:hypothetical protein